MTKGGVLSVATLAATLLAGCVFAYSFDSLETPVRPASDASPSPSAADVGSVSTRLCDGPFAEVPDLCDDFDDESPVGARWDIGGAVDNPVLYRDASVTRESPAATDRSPLVSRPSVLRMRASGERAKAALLHLLGKAKRGTARRGVEVSLVARPTVNEMPLPVEGGPLTGIMPVGFLTQSAVGIPAGVLLVLRDSTLYLAVTNDLSPAAPPPDRASFQPLTVLTASPAATWVRVRLAVGEREALKERGFSCDAMEPVVVAAEGGALFSACLGLKGSLGSIEWLDFATLALGPTILGEGTAEIFVDNVLLTTF